MKRLLLAVAILLSASSAFAQAVTDDCVTLYSGTGVTASQTSITPTRVNNRWKNFKFLVTSDINSGSTPTLDVKIQNCRSTTQATCKDTPATFTQCTAVGLCSTDGFETYDVTNFNLEGYVRPVVTVSGTINADVLVELCAK